MCRCGVWRNLVGPGTSAPAAPGIARVPDESTFRRVFALLDAAALDEASTTTMRSSSASLAEVPGFIY
ncbi:MULTISPECIES: hypothetical protein [unclassified Parafrankia]|uniref:hypothetical protein n=1 Tax=unclassified Parafrankia TaxID=2994368 RepID=UPI000DA4F9B0|nr:MULTISPECIES: hypothetical protein [unclassified Parafrankia]TCJ34986.1 hypothetical protein E0504_29995 [Parafrankia sp. BMG5.11]SQD97274.1 hypothetical protein FMEAI12_4020003 [Parafrankia sp. Ea1.12]